MKKFSFPVFIFLLLPLTIFAQSNLYMPKNFLNAYEKGTRSQSGMPGANYYQNSSNYRISAEIEPKTRNVKGKEHITYFNNSPDTLKRIYFRMYQDLYKPTTSRDRAISEKELTSGIQLYSIKINGQKLTEADLFRGETTMIAFPSRIIVPNSSTEIEIEWSFTIPNGTSIRMGAKDSLTFMVAYWYPQIAVYDDISGWDDLNYNGATEFYNDFNNYDVEIKAPYDFNVSATGLLQNPNEVFNSTILNKINTAKASDEVVRIIDSVSLKNKSHLNKKEGYNIWKYKAENVSDFVFGTSSNALWDATSAEVEPGRRVFISAVYNKEAKDFFSVNKVSRDVVLFYSNEFPKVAFPYPSLTVFNGQQRGGMEFPMFVNDRSAKTFNDMVDVTAHEIAHQYFPFYMGINEKKYTWMEEGMAQMLPEEIQDRLSDKTRKRKSNTQRYEFFAGDELEASMMTTAYLLKGDAFSMNAYFKSSVIYNLLRDYFGRDKYNEIMFEYMKRWNGKHPTPYDYFFTFNDVSGENLDWFWQPWFFEKGFPDLAIKEVKNQNGKNIFIIKNMGTLPTPVDISIVYSDGSTSTISKKMDIWKNGAKQIEVTDDSGKEIKSAVLGNDVTPDIDEKNNYYKK